MKDLLKTTIIFVLFILSMNGILCMYYYYKNGVPCIERKEFIGIKLSYNDYDSLMRELHKNDTIICNVCKTKICLKIQ